MFMTYMVLHWVLYMFMTHVFYTGSDTCLRLMCFTLGLIHVYDSCVLH